LGGVYFNALIMLATLGIYLVTDLEVLIFVILLLQFEMLHQFLPFLRLDGYYVIADLTGVPDIFARIRPVLASLLPGRRPAGLVTYPRPPIPPGDKLCGHGGCGQLACARLDPAAGAISPDPPQRSRHGV